MLTLATGTLLLMSCVGPAVIKPPAPCRPLPRPAAVLDAEGRLTEAGRVYLNSLRRCQARNCTVLSVLRDEEWTSCENP